MLDSKGQGWCRERDVQGELGVGVAEDGQGPATEAQPGPGDQDEARAQGARLLELTGTD